MQRSQFIAKGGVTLPAAAWLRGADDPSALRVFVWIASALLGSPIWSKK